MRFLENGPAIPDELLIARDEGRVVFFCGAGVSRARAGLVDFYGLAKGVIYKLGVPEEIAKTPKRATQYSSGTSKMLEIALRKYVDSMKGLTKKELHSAIQEYLDSIE